MKHLKYPTRSRQCATCIFRENSNVITWQRLAEIRTYLLTGTSHLCHTSPDKACKGGREYQALLWYRLGILKYPTITALEKECVKQLNAKPEK
jgi:hypothetical protein